MTRLAPLALILLLAGCQVYAGGGTLVSDGRTTVVRESSIEAGPETGARARSIEVVDEAEEPPVRREPRRRP